MNIKLISAGGGLVAFGALLGWAVTADRWEQRLKEQIDSNQARVSVLREKLNEAQAQQYITQNIYTEGSSDVETADSDSEKSPVGDSGETEVTDGEDEPSDEDIATARSHLEGVIAQYTADPEASSEEAERIIEVDRNEPPVVISMAEFSYSADFDHYEKQSLTWYPRHKILLEDDDQSQIDNVAATVGWRNLQRFGEEQDPNVLFVRNHRLETDFEVVQDEENDIPLHIKYNFPKDEFELGITAGVIKLRPEDMEVWEDRA